MTEAEWLACTDPQKMLEFLPSKGSDRKLRLFAVACCRRIWHLLVDERSRKAVEVVERFAEGEATDQERLAAVTAADPHHHARFGTRETPEGWPEDPGVATGFADAGLAAVCAAGSSAEIGAVALSDMLPTQVAYLHCIFGPLPFRSITVDPLILAWNDSTVRRIAEGIYEERRMPGGTLDNIRLAMLADALEESGCNNADILSHCRSAGPHVRGCWVVDLILGKE